MAEPGKLKRIRQRLELRLPVRVRCQEAENVEWTEITRLIDVTPFGAGFALKHPIEKGRLLHMTIPMPRQLRVFDHVEDQYRVWALVRYVKPVMAPEGNSQSFEVGVAFIGKHPPRGYAADPAKRYEIGSASAGNLSEIEDWVPTEVATSDKRIVTRHNIPVDMLIETVNEEGGVDQSERTVTENISQKGAALYTTLDLRVGRFIRLTSEQFKLTVHAAVRGHSMGPSGVPRVHVEFIDRDWPL
ncbi:MAG TPA: hypothetical protein VNO50_13670 [Pyrinomonadaceae bacterium]|nr:hypothetical protein [Pyrinomonadaceae bacterium]